VFITDPELTPALPSQRLRDLYGLTTAEAQTALSLVDAEGLRDVADRRGVSINTVRTHLQRIFDKAGTGRQTEVVRLLTMLDSANG